MADPIKEPYLNFDNKCRSYRRKLYDDSELLEKYYAAFDEYRERLKAMKRSLAAKSSSDDIELMSVCVMMLVWSCRIWLKF